MKLSDKHMLLCMYSGSTGTGGVLSLFEGNIFLGVGLIIIALILIGFAGRIGNKIDERVPHE